MSKLADKNNCARFEWWALKTNMLFIEFYERIRAYKLDELVIFRLNEKEILDLANANLLVS
ncbi:hypothetical protein MACH09_46580 [Vibrio sp. MACH09]|nr:hypothetical protein MACH09_46580 [Vibrio sp. MACH09]